MHHCIKYGVRSTTTRMRHDIFAWPDSEHACSTFLNLRVAMFKPQCPKTTRLTWAFIDMCGLQNIRESTRQAIRDPSRPPFSSIFLSSSSFSSLVPGPFLVCTDRGIMHSSSLELPGFVFSHKFFFIFFHVLLSFCWFPLLPVIVW
jgi:hypothetical protein